MLSVEIKINGLMIGHIHALNKGIVQGSLHNKYRFEYYIPGKGVVAEGTVLHMREEGAEVLVSKILNLVQSPNRKLEEV